MTLTRTLLAALASGLLAASASGADLPNGKAIYGATCIACHSAGVLGAPKLGDTAAWAPRIKAGAAALQQSAIKGKGAMPARGGNVNLTDADVQAAVNYMVAQAQAEAKPAAPKVAETKPAVPKAAEAAPLATPVAAPAPAAGSANPFNRLLKPASQRNLAPPEDGIHDPGNDGTHALQPPLAAFGPFPKSSDGNRIDWVKTLNENLITPRADRNDAAAQPMVMDLNIVREVKGSMPDVVYPHKQHTQWLDCSNCHPAIFIPQKGANQISMAAILLGQKCGVCHGKVAFPVSECRRCHSKSKPAVAAPENKP